MIVIFWKPGQLCRARVPELQKTPDQHRRRAVSGGHNGERALPSCAGRKGMGVSWQPCDGIYAIQYLMH